MVFSRFENRPVIMYNIELVSAERPDFVRRAGGELLHVREGITPESLYRDNHSPEAKAGRDIWEQTRNKFLVWTCSDSRVIVPNPTSTMVVRSLGAGIETELFGELVENPDIPGLIILGHHAGTAETGGQKGRTLKGCGAQAVKEDHVQADKTPQSDVEEWVCNHLEHADLINQVTSKAKDALSKIRRPVYIAAGSEDHLDGTIELFALFKKGQPEQFALPHLGDARLPASLREYVTGYSAEQFALMHRFFGTQTEIDGLPFAQRALAGALRENPTGTTQNPEMLTITTDIRPIEIRYPHTWKPGRVFQISVPGKKIRTAEDEGILPNQKDIKGVLDQVHYPVGHFSALNTILITTGKLKDSVDIADRLITRPWFEKWIAAGNHQLLVGQIKDGELEEVPLVYEKPVL